MCGHGRQPGGRRMPESLNLERLRKEAKSLLKRIRAGDASAIERIRVHLPKLVDQDSSQFALQTKLADIHHALAREQGYSSWAELKRHDSPLERFLTAVRSGALQTAQAELRNAPELATTSIHAACSIGDVDAVRHHLKRDPESLNARHNGWSPLIYACASRFHKRNPRHAAGILDCVTLLLDRGADPDSYTLADPSEPEIKIPAVARAQASSNSSVETLLRQHRASMGAVPISKAMSIALQQSLYPEPPLFDALTRTNRADPKFNEEIRRRIAPVRDRFFAVSDKRDMRKDPPALPLYLTEPDLKSIAIGLAEFALEQGVSPNLAFENEGNTLLHEFARLKDYPQVSAEAVEWLLEHGADPNIPRDDGQTPFVLAVRIGNNAAADVMRARGADIHSVRPMDELMGACRNRDAKKAAEILRQHPDMLRNMSAAANELLVTAAAANRPDDVRFMAQLGFNLGGIGENGSTALHVAAANGQVEMVQLLLELEAPVNVRDTTFGTSPLAWAARASKDSQREEDYFRIVEALLNAGTDRATCINRWGVSPVEVSSDRVANLLRSRGFSI
jgi:ankyrin repeat protein